VPRRTFFSFHYVPDIWRAWNVRNSWVVRGDEQDPRGFFDGSVFEESKKKGDDNLKRFLREGLANTSVTCILAGTSTWTRRWVRYEIAQSVIRGNGLLTVFIHGVQNSNQQVSEKGANPLDQMGLYRTDGGIFLAEWSDGKWVTYQDYQSSINEGDLWFTGPPATGVLQLSGHCMAYDFTAQNGRANIGGWIEIAAGLAGR
jgi:hypothetical protein